jgi:hypothetical protein
MIRKELARSGFEPPTSWLETKRSATISNIPKLYRIKESEKMRIGRQLRYLRARLELATLRLSALPQRERPLRSSKTSSSSGGFRGSTFGSPTGMAVLLTSWAFTGQARILS